MGVTEAHGRNRFEMEPLAKLLPVRRTRRGFNSEPPVKFTEEIIEVRGTGSFVTFDGEQLLEAMLTLLENPAIGTVRQMTLHIQRNRLSESAISEVVQ